MLDFTAPQMNDRAWISEAVSGAENKGSDLSFGNIYLLRHKYDTQICHYKDFLIRKYNGVNGREGYTFPVGNGDWEQALFEIKSQADRLGEELSFCLLTEEQKDLLNAAFPRHFEFACSDGDTDYIYSAEELANLKGKSFHKKKNHVSKFCRTYDDIRICPITELNREDAWAVEEEWCRTHLPQGEIVSDEERKAIREALDDFEHLALAGAILYVDDTPAAMTIASKINQDTCDIHFEKAVDEYAVNGAYSAVNQYFAKELTNFSWINREEDMGVEGLRKAKMSYHPKILLRKYSAKHAV